MREFRTQDVDRREKSTALAVILFGISASIYLFTFAGILKANTLQLKLIYTGINGFTIAILFVIGHDCCHGSFFGGQIRGTPHIEFPGVVDFVLHNVMHHTAHHVDPKIPLYNLRQSQRSLEAAYESEIIHIKWTFSGFFKTMQTCRLYDYQQHRLIDFDGTPKSASLIR